MWKTRWDAGTKGEPDVRGRGKRGGKKARQRNLLNVGVVSEEMWGIRRRLEVVEKLAAECRLKSEGGDEDGDWDERESP